MQNKKVMSSLPPETKYLQGLFCHLNCIQVHTHIMLSLLHQQAAVQLICLSGLLSAYSCYRNDHRFSLQYCYFGFASRSDTFH